MTEYVEIRGLEGVLKALQSLPAELVSKNGGVVAAGLRKGAAVMRKAWQAEVQRMVDEPNIGGRYKDIGLYKRSISVSRARDPKKYGGDEVVRVIMKKGKYPDGDPVAMIASILEHGDEKMAAKAPMRKAFDSTKQAALDAAVAGIKDGTEKAIQKAEQMAKM